MCNPNSNCVDVSVNCPADYQCNVTFANYTKCDNKCMAFRPRKECACPPDKEGEWCEEQGNVTCKVTSFNSSAPFEPEGKSLGRKDPTASYAANIYNFDNEHDIEFSMTLSCTNTAVFDNAYTYWINEKSVCMKLAILTVSSSSQMTLTRPLCSR